MKPDLHKISKRVTGKIHQGYDPFTGKAFTMVYQRVRKGLGNLDDQGKMGLQLRVEPPRTDKKSLSQLRCRARLTAATAAWKTLDTEQKFIFSENAVGKNITGYNLFISGYCKQHPLSDY
ncbi:MAG: hypothetical protein WCG16_09430 [Methylococcales bacterium]|jgi:hypothetical protein